MATTNVISSLTVFLTFCSVVQFHFTAHVLASPVHQQIDYNFNMEKVVRALKSGSVFPPSQQDNYYLHRDILQEYDHTLPHVFSQKRNHSRIREKREKYQKNIISPRFGIEPDAKRDVVQLITSLGYPAEQHTVQTDDGYLLILHRIPYGRNNKDGSTSGSNSNSNRNSTNNAIRPSVFLQHGLLSSAADWVMNFPNDSLAFVLADHGYDVWLGNSRGNTYSMRHVNLNPHEDAFWDFSFDEMAKYDLPAFIDFILEKTGEPSLYYIGHSQGTIMAFAGFSSVLPPEYQKKIRLFVGLAPIISISHMKSPIKYLSLLTDPEGYLLLGRKSFLENDFVLKLFVDELCDKALTNWVCSNIVFVLCGYDTTNMNKTRLTVYMNHTPAGTSVKNMIHYAQYYRAKTFAMYDYGSEGENLKRYNQTSPPVYEPRNFNIPSLLYTATNDWLADPTDVNTLESTIPDIVGKLNIPEWNHLDFVWGMDAADKCYKDILQWLPKY